MSRQAVVDPTETTSPWGFHSELCLQKKSGGRWILLSDLVYEAKDTAVYIAHAGDETDLASIPRGLWNVFPPIGDYDWAAVIHDSLYTNQSVTRERADSILLEAMEATKVGWWARRTIYLSVRVGGRGIWKRHAQAKAEAERIAALTAGPVPKELTPWDDADVIE